MNARTLDRAGARPLTGTSGAGRSPAPEGLPLTAAQSGMWFAQALDPGSPALGTAEYLEIHGDIDPARFAEALHRTVGEADALRVAIADAPGGPRQLPIAVEAPGHGFPLHTADLRDTRDPDASALTWMRADLAEPFDLARGPLFSHALLRVGDERWLWYQRVHHAVLDGYGYSLVARRVAELYTALATGEDPAPSPFGRLADLVAEDAAYRDSATRTRDRAHWLTVFADRPEAPTLASAGPAARPALPSRTHLRVTAHLAPEATARLRRLAASVRATWTDVLFAAQALYVARATRSEDVVLGLPMMGRMGSVALRVPGMVMNVLPLRLAVTPGTTFAELVHQAVLGIRAARRHQRYRYEDIRRDLGLLGEGRPLTGPLVNVMPFDYGLTFAGARSDAHNLAPGPVDDLTVGIYDRADGSGLRIDYDANPARYGQDELAAHQARFLDLLTRLAERDPHLPLGGLPLATDAEREQVLTEFNDTATEVPPTTLIGPVEARAARTPHATALVDGEQSLTYAALNARANRLARHLRTLGVAPGTLAAVALPRSTDLVVALLAVLKAGGAYVPLDTADPAARLRETLAAAAPVCVLTDRAGSTALPAGTAPVVVLDAPALAETLAAQLPTDPGRALTPQHPAYVLHTSGTTGAPKGVVVPHSAVDNRLRWMQAQYPLIPGDRVLHKTPTGFDVSVWELFWPLREGATLVLAGPEAHRDPAELARTIREQGVTVTHFVPSVLQLFLAEPGAGACTGLRHVFSSGEVLPRATAEDCHRLLPGTALHNLYGPTEAAVDVTHHTCRPGETGPVPIGRPAWNTRLYILDAALQPCPPGVPGELYLAGAQLADGYLGRPDLTAERFVDDPFAGPGSRMYRTGDLARWREDGEAEYLGRTDRQVKLHGRRIEPDGVEAVLQADPRVQAACAVVREDRPGDRRLVAYVTPVSADAAAEAGTPSRPAPDALREALAAQLPEAMVPSAVVVLDAFPTGPNGKLDRAALPAPDPQADTCGRAPAGPREETLTRLFAEVLGLPHVGVDDSFFALGGTSLLAARLVARIRDVFGDGAGVTGGADAGEEGPFAMGALFRAPTPAALARRLGGTAGAAGTGGAAGAAPKPVLTLRATGSRTPLFALPPAAGLGWCYASLLAGLGPDQPLHALQARALAPGEPLPATLEEMAADYAERIRTVRPHGPYRLLGWSAGGVLAHAVAVRLQEAGEKVELLALLDAYPAAAAFEEQAVLGALLDMAGRAQGDGAPLTRDGVLAALRADGGAFAALTPRTLQAVVDVALGTTDLAGRHPHRVFDGDVLFFTATGTATGTAAVPAPGAAAGGSMTREAWRPYVTGRVINRDVACPHAHMTQPGPAAEVAEAVTRHLGES
ncbi:amino acid adenylation domain-containing protein [Streptomyces sp. URMC 124]|uniref:amino acid adenylation domain-containing protein n=1 Tax=Streptomyces sp. URMC 124 TaxID=3423405 RepID=UPI003F1D7981